jgi:signal transduction histidine kinase/CheY-like chemotaxis protein
MANDQEELESLRRQLAEANATLEAIRSGGVDAVVVDVGDVDEVYTLQSSDLPYWTFLEQMAEGALSLGANHEVVYCNQFMCDLIGLPREEIVGQSVLLCLDEPSRTTFARAAGQATPSTIAANLLCANRQLVPVLMSVVPPRNGNSRRCNVVVTDQRADHHLKQVTKAHDAAKAESHAKDRFLAVLGHELRNPLAALANSVAVLEEVSLPEARRQSVYAGMSRQIQQLNSLVDDLLDLTRVAQGKVVLKRQLINLNSVVSDATSSVRSAIEQKLQTLVIDVTEPGLQIEADQVRLEQILINLLTNASRYTPNGGTVTLRVREENGSLQLSVTDTGIGLEADQLERIFEPFAQVGEEGTGGLGIGLSLVRQLMQLHGGTVVAQSPGLGLGTTVTLTLPNVRADRMESTSSVARRDTRTGTEPSLKVLIVDDNEDAAEMLSLILSTMGHQTDSVSLGREVQAAVERFEPELVLLDLGLPDISGYAVAKQLREAGHRDLLIVALTGFSHESARTRTIEAGINAHLIKPVTVEQILSTVKECRRAPRAKTA